MKNSHYSLHAPSTAIGFGVLNPSTENLHAIAGSSKHNIASLIEISTADRMREMELMNKITNQKIASS